MTETAWPAGALSFLFAVAVALAVVHRADTGRWPWSRRGTALGRSGQRLGRRHAGQDEHEGGFVR